MFIIQYFIVGALVYGVIFSSIKTQGNLSEKKKKKALRVIAIFIFSMVSFVSIFQWRDIETKKNEFLLLGFNSISENHYNYKLNDFIVNIIYHPQVNNDSSGQPYFEISILSDKVRKGIATLFCSSSEYNNFINGSHDWFPTPEIKLENGHYVGKCYSQKTINEIAKLPKRFHDLTPRSARYLYLPVVTSQNEQVLSVYTNNTDVSTFMARLKELLNYYEIVLQQ